MKNARAKTRSAFREPPQPELEGRVGLTERVEQRAVLVELLRGALHRERWELLGVDGVDLRRDRAAL